MFEHRLHLSKIGHTFLNGVSLSDLIQTYVVTGAYCLVYGRVWRFYRRNKDRLDPLSSTLKMRVGEKNRTNTREFVVYTLRGVMEICRLSTHLDGFATRLLFSPLLSISICVVKYDGIIVRIP